MCFRNNEIREILPQLFPIFPQTTRISKIRKVMPTRLAAIMLIAGLHTLVCYFILAPYPKFTLILGSIMDSDLSKKELLSF